MNIARGPAEPLLESQSRRLVSVRHNQPLVYIFAQDVTVSTVGHRVCETDFQLEHVGTAFCSASISEI